MSLNRFSTPELQSEQCLNPRALELNQIFIFQYISESKLRKRLGHPLRYYHTKSFRQHSWSSVSNRVSTDLSARKGLSYNYVGLLTQLILNNLILKLHIINNKMIKIQSPKQECGFFTWDRDDNHCYIVKSDYYLEPSDDKVSGSRDCIDQSTGVGGFDGMTQWG